jgi:hypothetical protein
MEVNEEYEYSSATYDLLDTSEALSLAERLTAAVNDIKGE